MTRREGSGGGDVGDELETSDPDRLDGDITRVFEMIPRQKALAAPAPVQLFERVHRGAAPPGMASSEQLEAFRELRTRLLLMAEGVGLARFTTLVVPLSVGAGASFVARNLAAAFTLQEQLTVVLVDCDFRNPGQNGVIDRVHDGAGLSDYLDTCFYSAAEQPVLMRKLIVPTPIRGLYLVPAGRREAVLAGRPREYFSSAAMRTLVARLRVEPCFVILDGPPIAGSPDARILSDLADFVVLVVGYGQSSPSAIAAAAALFDRTKFAGVVFNEAFGVGRA